MARPLLNLSRVSKTIGNLIVFVFFVLTGNSLLAQKVFVLNDDTPIIFSDKANVLVLEEPQKELTIYDVLVRENQFLPAQTIKNISTDSAYWIKQSLTNQSSHEKLLRVSFTGWADHQNYIFRQGKVEKLKVNGVSTNYNLFADINPFITSAKIENSQYPLFRIKSGEILEIFSRVKSSANLRSAESFYLEIYDHSSYLELRRLGVYFEGSLLGLIFALTVFGWYSFSQYRDKTSFTYAIWLSVCITQCLLARILDGQRGLEFFWIIENKKIDWQYVSNYLWVISTYSQGVLFVVFARSFLDLKIHFPIFYKITNIWICTYLIHMIANLTMQQRPNMVVFYLFPLVIPTLLILLSLYVCAHLRLRQGLREGILFLAALFPYMFFRASQMIPYVGYPSPLNSLPKEGGYLFFQSVNSSQLFALCLEALIMSLAVISRTRWLQKDLADSIQKHSELINNQNKFLEKTVIERTKELSAKHEVVVSSVNYASRLQRGQLPRQMRIDGRFASFASIWEPRDTIGGDLYWLSSSQQSGPFVLAVADCTGHGVPGAMLSLLVSNSLERIYANDTAEDPASALMSLDYYVRTGLNQDRADSESDDGCDAAVLRIDRDKQAIEFAGAKLGLFQVSASGVLTRHLGSRCSLGYQDHVTDADKPIVQKFPYQSGDVFAVVTDGFTDQIGGTTGKTSFGYRRLEDILKTHCAASTEEITAAMKLKFAAWQGTNARRDDVTAVVFKL